MPRSPEAPVSVHNPDHLPHSADVVVIGGGPLGIHIAHRLDQEMGNKASNVLITEGPIGGLADRSLEQYRGDAHQSGIQVAMVRETRKLYKELADELNDGGRGDKRIDLETPFPYVFAFNTTKQREFFEEIIRNTKNWGYGSSGEIVSADEIKYRYPFLDGGNIDEEGRKSLLGAAIFHDAGRLHFDTAKTAMMQRSGNTTFASGVRAQEVLFDRSGKVTGVKSGNGEVIHTEKVIFAPGGFVMHLDQFIPGVEEVRSFASSFAVTRRELFTAPAEGLDEDMKLFVISPQSSIEGIGGMAIVRFENGTAYYGWADPQELPIQQAEVDPHARTDMEFPAITYALLADCMPTKYGSDSVSGPWARDIEYRSAGYYAEHRGNGLPAVGELLPGSNLYVAAGASHTGVMAAEGIARIIVDNALYQKSIPEEVVVFRSASGEKESLVL